MICSCPLLVIAPLEIVCPVASIPPLKVESLVTLSSSTVAIAEDVKPSTTATPVTSIPVEVVASFSLPE